MATSEIQRRHFDTNQQEAKTDQLMLRCHIKAFGRVAPSIDERVFARTAAIWDRLPGYRHGHD